MEETTLDTQQRKDGRNLLHSVITDTGRYMAAGIQYANRKAGVTDRDFWEGLFVPTGSRESDVILRANRNADPAKCPEDPYGELDIQACNKYLLHGGKRTVVRNHITQRTSMRQATAVHMHATTASCSAIRGMSHNAQRPQQQNRMHRRIKIQIHSLFSKRLQKHPILFSFLFTADTSQIFRTWICAGA